MVFRLIMGALAAAGMVIAAAGLSYANPPWDPEGMRTGGAPASQVQRNWSFNWNLFGGSQGPVARQVVTYPTNKPPGTIIVNTKERRLYLILGNGQAMRYGIGVGRTGFQWAGVHRVSAKREWPSWTPPPAMLRRQPYLPRFMEGGPDNPLGARALYIGSSIYRIHGSNEPDTIGTEVSSGCFRMTNADVIDLYERVRVGALVIVIR